MPAPCITMCPSQDSPVVRLRMDSCWARSQISTPPSRSRACPASPLDPHPVAPAPQATADIMADRKVITHVEALVTLLPGKATDWEPLARKQLHDLRTKEGFVRSVLPSPARPGRPGLEQVPSLTRLTAPRTSQRPASQERRQRRRLHPAHVVERRARGVAVRDSRRGRRRRACVRFPPCLTLL